jgi:hypothetical protein
MTPHYTHEHCDRQHAIDCFRRAIRTPEFKAIKSFGFPWGYTHTWVRHPYVIYVYGKDGNLYYHNSDGTPRIGKR